MSSTEETKLGRIRAVWHALRAAEVSHYPRFLNEAGKEQKLDEAELIGRIASVLGTLSFDDKAGNDSLRQVRESLNEVKALTEYEDQKATRVLTIVTIFVALAGFIFTRVADMPGSDLR